MSRVGISKFIVLPMAQPDLGEMERGNINEALIDNAIGVGRFVGEFERTWAEYNRYKFGVACNSGTSALHLAIKASGAKKVHVPNLTMAGTAWPALYENLEVTYAPTLKGEPASSLEVPDVDAVIFVHLYGRRAYPEGFVTKLKAQRPNLIVIDDMAEAHGVFSEGDIACYSFYGNKILTTGEGGMCLTNKKDLADEMRSLANMYFDKERSMVHPKVGHNYRMTNLQAAVGLAQAERVDFLLKKRSQIEKWYDKYLPEAVKLPPRDVLWFYDIKVPNAEKAQKYLKSQGCDSRRFFYPCSLQSWGNGMKDAIGEKWYKHGLLLPVHTTMTEGDVKWVAELVTTAISKYKKTVVI